MKHYPSLHTVTGLIAAATDVRAETPQGWVPARSMGYPSLRHRIRLAWGVFVGRYDALKWPGDQ